jgi:hypothetical protein
MKLPDLPENEQDPKPNSDESPGANEQPEEKPAWISLRETLTHHPKETDEMPDWMAKDKSSSRRTTGNEAKAETSSKASGEERLPDRSPLTENHPARTTSNSNNRASLPVDNDNNPGRKLRSLEAAVKNARPAKVPWRYRLRPNREWTHRAYWDVTAALSLIVNAVLIGFLLIMAGQIRNLKTTMNDLFGGLYGNFAKMDQATIDTTITANAQIPLNFNLPISQNTEVMLTRDISIPGARVVINSGILNINAKANITLPAGTSLPIELKLDVPVQSTIPISMQVPVSIPLNQTGLHEPLIGLQTNLLPLYCMFDKNAQYPEGIYICAEHDTPSPGTP